MANMIFDNKQSYRKMLDDLIDQCDIFTLDKILHIILKHLYPKCY